MKFRMRKNHGREKLSAFVNRELPEEERQAVGEHLLHCRECRQEHAAIRFGAELAARLRPAENVPADLWPRIEAALDRPDRDDRRRSFAFFGGKRAAALAALLLVSVIGLFAVYYRSAGEGANETARSGTAPETRAEPAAVWPVETLSGSPRIEHASVREDLAVGGILETDERSRAKIDVADIGVVEVEPNSLVKLVRSSRAEHRLSLERGTLQARIVAPPRLFVVDTPSAVAVDLGCAYRLEVDRAGNSRLHVTSGYVALERDDRESIVPAGAICLTKRGKGLGTPYFETAGRGLREALYELDFKNGGRPALEKVVRLAGARDTLTLWHLLRRVPREDRALVLGKILAYTKLPSGITRAGLLELDEEMVRRLKLELQIIWYE